MPEASQLRPGEIAVAIGTRPEAIKLMPVVRALEAAGAPPTVFLTGQHQELLDATLEELEIVPDEDLDLMEPDQSLGDLSARVLVGMQDLLRRRRPRALVVQGDTTSVAMAALAGFYEDVSVAHVEAGLRTGVRRNPFPEEMNRRLAACLADLHFAPTPRARENLLEENVAGDRIHVVGNTVIDALFHARDHLLPALPADPELDGILRSGRKLVLVTAHRRESFGPDLRSVCTGIRRVAERFGDALEVVFPVHLNPNVQAAVQDVLPRVPNVRLLPPLSYLRFARLLMAATLVITDSGGVQEEASALGIPILVVRRTTERPEAVEAGVAELTGPEADRISGAAQRLLTDEGAYRARAVPTQVFGDGRAAERIVRVLSQEP